MIKFDIETIKRLSVRERVRLVQEIWDTLQPTASELPVTDEQRDIVIARLERHRRDPSAAIPWSEVRRELGLEWSVGKPIRLDPEARIDLFEAAVWYSEKGERRSPDRWPRR